MRAEVRSGRLERFLPLKDKRLLLATNAAPREQQGTKGRKGSTDEGPQAEGKDEEQPRREVRKEGRGKE